MSCKIWIWGSLGKTERFCRHWVCMAAGCQFQMERMLLNQHSAPLPVSQTPAAMLIFLISLQQIMIQSAHVYSTLGQRHPKCFTFHHNSHLWKRYWDCPTSQRRALRPTLIAVEGLGHTPRLSGSIVFAYKHCAAILCNIALEYVSLL